jgi:hypothetical protein
MEPVLFIALFVVLALVMLPRSPNRWNGEDDPDKMT